MCTNGNKVTVDFSDATFTFHAQWLHDARCDEGPARNAETAFCQSNSTVHVQSVQLAGCGLGMTLHVCWEDGKSSQFPASWLRVMAPLVAAPQSSVVAKDPQPEKGWLVNTLNIPEISYEEIARLEEEDLDALRLRVLDSLLHKAAPGILKIIDLPDPNIKEEQKRDHKNNIITRVLKQLFGSVWVHPIRGADTTFNVSSHSDDAKRAELPNYDIKQVLLPHTDHAFYDSPVQIMGFYGLEGKSENTWVSSLAALHTFEVENPDLLKHLRTAPMAIGRVSRFYGLPLYQATVDAAVTMQPGSPNEIKRLRWHPNLTGSLLAPYHNFKMARLAHQKLEEIMRRDTHQLKLVLNPGDLYIWNNFTLLHGRERVIEVPRTGVGQTVPEQAIADRYRELQVKQLTTYVDEKWLIHMPIPQLREMRKLVQNRLDAAESIIDNTSATI